MRTFSPPSRLIVALLTVIAASPSVSAAQQTPARPVAQPPVPATRDTLVDLLMQLEALQMEVRQLRGQVETQTHEVERLRARQRDLIGDLDRRLRELERTGTGRTGDVAPSAAATPPRGASTPTPPPAAATPRAPIAVAEPSPGPVPPRGAAAATAADEQREYDAAFNLMKQGFYDRAARNFAEFIAKYPNSRLRDNARYWIGEANYVVRNFRKAVEEFGRVLSEHPNSDKAADSLLKIGYSHYELGDWAKARESLNAVVARYPNTTVARLAEVRLEKMKQEGH